MADFVYQPPPAAITAKRILIKPNLGYPVPPPVTVSLPVLSQVLRGLRGVNPGAEIILLEGVCSAISLREIIDILGVKSILDPGITILDADSLTQQEYPNISPFPVRFTPPASFPSFAVFTSPLSSIPRPRALFPSRFPAHPPQFPPFPLQSVRSH